MKLVVASSQRKWLTLITINVIVYATVFGKYTWDSFSICVRHSNKLKPVSRERLLAEVQGRMNGNGVLISKKQYPVIYNNPLFDTTEETIQHIESLYNGEQVMDYELDSLWIEEFMEPQDPIVFI